MALPLIGWHCPLFSNNGTCHVLSAKKKCGDPGCPLLYPRIMDRKQQPGRATT